LGRYIPVHNSRVVSNPNNDDNNNNNNDEDEDEDVVVYPNLVELELSRPSPLTLQTIQSIQCTINNDIASSIHGDICTGLILAADTLHRRTNGKKYNRKIVLFTDAEHEVDVNGEQLHFVLGELKKMEVELLVVGIDFLEKKEEEEGKPEAVSSSIIHDKPDTVSSSIIHDKPDAVVSMEEDGDNNNTASMMVKEEEGNPDDIIDDDTNILVELIKRENEKLLHSIVREVGGSILIANGSTSLTNVLHTKLPNISGLTNSMGKKMEFRIAPDLTIMIKSAKLTSQQNLPSTIKEAYQYDPGTGDKLRDGNGELMTLPTRTQTDHYDDEGTVVTFDKRTDAFRYGSDLIPVGKMDLLGISAAFTDPGSIEMMGYIDRKVVEDSNLLMGPAYAITGGAESKKSQSAIAALAMALDETSMIGLCRIVRTKNGTNEEW
jgi:ATP-dependent DNA helicase 2 subunit 2